MSPLELAGSEEFHEGSQPEPGIFGCAPAPAAGGLTSVPPPLRANARKRPTLTLKRSSRKELTVAGIRLLFARLNVPPGTVGLSQQSPPAHVPPASSAQLGGAVVAPSSASLSEGPSAMGASATPPSP